MFTLNCKGKLLRVDKPLVMGIINITPDSFYEYSRFMTEEGILKQAEKMIREGADILDIGGQSTRPGTGLLGEEEELNRVIGAVKSVHNNFPEVIISIDTYYSKVAKEGITAGASIINDISAGNLDKAMLSVVGEMGVPYVCMHMKGEPRTMQQDPVYENVTLEVLDFFIQKKEECKMAGIKDIILDPGFGFGKKATHNFELLRNLSVFKMAGCLLLLGISRKATIYKTLGISAKESLNGTTVLNTIGLLNGADILRVHDVKEAKEAISLFSNYIK
jgi:dihydropteroate synthase